MGEDATLHRDGRCTSISRLHVILHGFVWGVRLVDMPSLPVNTTPPVKIAIIAPRTSSAIAISCPTIAMPLNPTIPILLKKRHLSLVQVGCQHHPTSVWEESCHHC